MNFEISWCPSPPPPQTKAVSTSCSSSSLFILACGWAPGPPGSLCHRTAVGIESSFKQKGDWDLKAAQKTRGHQHRFSTREKIKPGQQQNKASDCKQTSLCSLPCGWLRTPLRPHPCLPTQSLGGAWGAGPAPQSPGTTATPGQHGTRGALGHTRHIPPFSPPCPPRWLGRNTKAILSVLISSALHVLGERGQLCGRLAEFQEVDVFLGFDSSLFALDEVATRENPFASSPLGWHWPQQGGSPWDTARGLSPHRLPSLARPPRLSLRPGLAPVPPDKVMALGRGAGEGGSPEQGQGPEGAGPEGSSLHRWDGGVSQRQEGDRQAASRCLPKRLCPRRPEGAEAKRAEGQGEAEVKTSGHPHCMSPGPRGWARAGAPARGEPQRPQATKPHLLLPLPPQTSKQGWGTQNEETT